MTPSNFSPKDSDRSEDLYPRFEKNETCQIFTKYPGFEKNEIHQNFTKAAKISFPKSGKDFATHESFKGKKDCPGNGQDSNLVLAKKFAPEMDEI